MSKYSEFLKTKALNEKEKFFGETKNVSNQYFTFNRVIDNDNILLITNNVIINARFNKIMLVVGNNKAIYLQEWQIKKMSSNGYDDCYAVKLNRNFFKVYTFQKEFDDFYFKKDETFDDLLEIAKEQQEVNMAFKTNGNVWE